MKVCGVVDQKGLLKADGGGASQILLTSLVRIEQQHCVDQQRGSTSNLHALSNHPKRSLYETSGLQPSM